MARGGKTKGAKRGGHSRFAAQSAEEIEERNRRLEEFDAQRQQRRAEAGCSDGEDEEEKDGEAKAPTPTDAEAAFEKQAHQVGERVAQMTVDDEPESALVEEYEQVEEAPQMSRREREEAEKKAKAEAYRKRHEAGLTEEYRRDMEKLAEVKARREVAALKAAQEKEAQDAMEKELRQKAVQSGFLDTDSDDDDKKKSSKKKSSSKPSGPPKLDKIAIKKMKPAQLKDALKERGLEIHGNAKELLKRLTDYEASR